MEQETLTYNHYIIPCETLTPVHIGSGNSLSSIGEYYAGTNRLVFIDQLKIDSLLSNIEDEDFVSTYVAKIKEQVSASKSDFSIVTFLKENGIELNQIASGDEIQIFSGNYDTHKNSQLKLACKQNKKLYFPGSSIKGAIKTVLFYKYLQNNPALIENWERIIEDSPKKEKYFPRWKDEIEKDFMLFEKAQKSDFSFLRIEDTSSFDETNRGAWEVGRYHLHNNNEEMMQWLCEGVKSHTEFDIRITIRPEMNAHFLKEFNTLEIHELYSLINNFTCAQLAREKVEISDSNLPVEVKKGILEKLSELEPLTLNNDQALLRIGAGKTFFFHTVCSLLNAESFNKLRNLIKIGKTEISSFPLSRSFTSDYEGLGWILLKKRESAIKILEKEIEPEEELEIVAPLNNPDNLVANQTILNAVYMGNKRVTFNINKAVMEVHLALAPYQKHIEFKKGEILTVYIKEISKNGRITMVGIKE